jgi:transposase-like protein
MVKCTQIYAAMNELGYKLNSPIVNVDKPRNNVNIIESWNSPTIAVKATSQKRETNRSWRMDETYIKVKGEWGYLYRAVTVIRKPHKE